MRPTNPSFLYMVGLMVGVPDGMLFEPDKNFVGCRICGNVYQSTLDRYPQTPEHVIEAQAKRNRWAKLHAATHADSEHQQLRQSGMFCTPEAAPRLAALGVVPMSDLILDSDIATELRSSKAMPTDDVEGDSSAVLRGTV